MQQQSWQSWYRRSRLAGESGSVSVEFAIWLPLLVVLLVTIVDASSAMMRQGTMWRVAGDFARGVATGQIDISDAQAQLARLGYQSVKARRDGDMALVQISMPFSAIGTGSLLTPLGSLDVVVVQRLEPHARSME